MILSLFLLFCINILLEVPAENNVYLNWKQNQFYCRKTNAPNSFFGYPIFIIINMFKSGADFGFTLVSNMYH